MPSRPPAAPSAAASGPAGATAGIPARHAFHEVRSPAAEDAASQHDVDVEPGHPQPADRRADHPGHLVGEVVDQCARAAASPSAAQRKTSGGSSVSRRLSTLPVWIASRHRQRARAGRSARARRAPASALRPAAVPAADRGSRAPSRPSSRRRPRRPRSGPARRSAPCGRLGLTAAQLSPVPQTTPTPHPRSVPARSTAKVSLRTITASASRGRAGPWSAGGRPTGRSTPAMQNTPTSASGPAPGRIRRARRPSGSTRTRPATERSWSSGENDVPRRGRRPITRPAAAISAASILVAPPSTASTACASELHRCPPARRRSARRSVEDWQRIGRHVRPGMQQQPGAVAVLAHAVAHPPAQLARPPAPPPSRWGRRPSPRRGSPAVEQLADVRVVLPRAVGAAEPRAWIDAAGLGDGLSGIA